MEELLKKYIVYYMLSIVCITFIHIFIFKYLNMNFFVYYNACALCFNILTLIYVIKFPLVLIKPFVNFYLIKVSLYLFIYGIFFWKETPVAFFWLFLIPFFTMGFYSPRVAIYWIIYILLLIVFTIISSNYLHHFFDEVVFPVNGVAIVNTSALLSIFYLFIFGIYYNSKIGALAYQTNETVIEKNDKSDILVIQQGVQLKNDEKDDKLEGLYYEILHYFNDHHPFCNSDFSMIHLANALDTNVTYISRTIRKYANTNFNTFVNRYRIDMVKRMIDDNKLQKHSLLYVYTSAGFKHQSTFNKVFKQIEGITPSEYMRSKV